MFESSSYHTAFNGAEKNVILFRIICIYGQSNLFVDFQMNYLRSGQAVNFLGLRENFWCLTLKIHLFY